MALHKAVKDAGISDASQSDLFKDFYNTRAICTHPLILAMKKSNGEQSYDNHENDEDTDTSESESSDSNAETSSAIANSR